MNVNDIEKGCIIIAKDETVTSKFLVIGHEKGHDEMDLFNLDTLKPFYCENLFEYLKECCMELDTIIYPFNYVIKLQNERNNITL